ncbi:MAG TPA: creatininase family protein [Candidatus Limnocylindria bacterium]|jgi:creatinine amidohydrolase|nr:creatininase family protein [Candidatus Limnocylindria bacterium]
MHELKWPDIAEYLRTNDVVLIPIGNVEQHGAHLPLMTDAAQAIDVAVAAAERTGVLIAPPLWIGWTPWHMGFPGSFTLRGETLIRVAEDVSYCLVSHGFKKLIWITRGFNSAPLRLAQASIGNRTNALVAVLDHAEIVAADVHSRDWDVSAHAGGAETSHMLYLHPELVDLTKATANPWPYKDLTTIPTYLQFKRDVPTGGAGDPTHASREQGQEIFKRVVDVVVAYIDKVRPVAIETLPVDLPV